MLSDNDTAPVADQQDWSALETWLHQQLPNLDGPMSVRQFTGGHANLTYCVSIGESELVVRRPPFGDIAPGAHDMWREYRVLAGLGPVFDPAPQALGFCEDTAVIGAPFLVVERRHGVVVRDEIPAELADVADVASKLSLALVDALANLHAIDPNHVGLERLGRPDGFVDRQLAGWHDRWHRINEGPNDRFDAVHARLVDTQPTSSRVSILHNDFKLDNAMFTPGQPERVSSIFDWDMATLGDPLIDLGTLLGYWKSSQDAVDRAPTIGLDMSDFPTAEALVQRYASAGHNVDHIEWYEAFASWKHAVVLKQLHQRFVDGDSSDQRLGELGAYIDPIIELAASNLEK